MSVFEELIDNKILKILKLLLQNKEQQFHLYKIAQESNIPVATVFRIMKRLLRLSLVQQTIIGKFKLYSIAHNKKTKELYLSLKNG
jgi:DNA-binding IclR family transcriptional regulator